MKATIRAFVAFKLPERVIGHAEALQDKLKAHHLKLRWVKPQNIHLTLKFLGDIPEADITTVGSALEKAVKNQEPLEMTVQGMGVFPSIKRPRVLWIGLGGALESLKQLQTRLEEQLEKIGFKREKRGFKAHLTIARIKGAIPPDRLLRAMEQTADYTPQSFVAQKIVFYKSDLRPQGPVYTPLVTIDL